MKKMFAAAALALGTGLAGMMRGTQDAVPFMARPTPRFERQESTVEKDGYGRRIKPKVHPRHNAFKGRYSRAHRAFADKVRSTHSRDAQGNFQEDPRDAKYLNNHALLARAERLAKAS